MRKGTERQQRGLVPVGRGPLAPVYDAPHGQATGAPKGHRAALAERQKFQGRAAQPQSVEEYRQPLAGGIHFL